MKKVSLLCLVTLFALFAFAGQLRAVDFDRAGDDTPAILVDLATSDPTRFLSDEEIAYVRGQGWDLGVYATLKVLSLVTVNYKWSFLSNSGFKLVTSASASVSPFSMIAWNGVPYKTFGAAAPFLQDMVSKLSDCSIPLQANYSTQYGKGVSGAVNLWYQMPTIWIGAIPVPWGLTLGASYAAYLSGYKAVTGNVGVGIGISQVNLNGGVYATLNNK